MSKVWLYLFNKVFNDDRSLQFRVDCTVSSGGQKHIWHICFFWRLKLADGEDLFVSQGKRACFWCISKDGWKYMGLAHLYEIHVVVRQLISSCWCSFPISGPESCQGWMPARVYAYLKGPTLQCCCNGNYISRLVLEGQIFKYTNTNWRSDGYKHSTRW